MNMNMNINMSLSRRNQSGFSSYNLAVAMTSWFAAYLQYEFWTAQAMKPFPKFGGIRVERLLSNAMAKIWKLQRILDSPSVEFAKPIDHVSSGPMRSVLIKTTCSSEQCMSG